MLKYSFYFFLASLTLAIIILTLVFFFIQQNNKELSYNVAVVSSHPLPTSFNPLYSESRRFGLPLIYDTLLQKTDNSTTVNPKLTDVMSIDYDNKTIDIKVNLGTRWSDGTYLSSNDVVFSLKYYKLFYEEMAKAIQQVTQVEDDKLEINYSGTPSNVVKLLTQYPILPANVWRNITTRMYKNIKAIGTGQYNTITQSDNNSLKICKNKFSTDKIKFDCIVFMRFSSDEELQSYVKTNNYKFDYILDKTESLNITTDIPELNNTYHDMEIEKVNIANVLDIPNWNSDNPGFKNALLSHKLQHALMTPPENISQAKLSEVMEIAPPLNYYVNPKNYHNVKEITESMSNLFNTTFNIDTNQSMRLSNIRIVANSQDKYATINAKYIAKLLETLGTTTDVEIVNSTKELIEAANSSDVDIISTTVNYDKNIVDDLIAPNSILAYTYYNDIIADDIEYLDNYSNILYSNIKQVSKNTENLSEMQSNYTSSYYRVLNSAIEDMPAVSTMKLSTYRHFTPINGKDDATMKIMVDGFIDAYLRHY